MTTTAIVNLRGIRKSFSGAAALRGVDIDLRPGRIHALVGENGAGKSTLLNILAGLLEPDEGEILLQGSKITLNGPRAAWSAGIITVHQEVDLFPDLSVQENIAWQHGRQRSPIGSIAWSAERHQAIQALATVGSPVRPDDLAATLTPAQRQLVEIAGAVTRSASVLILDEPTSSLSDAESDRLFTHLRQFRDRGTAIVYVSHRFEEIFALADEITVLRDGQRVWHGDTGETNPSSLIRHMVGRELPARTRQSLSGSGRVRLSCRDLTSRNGSFTGVNLEARAGEILGLYGLIGAGRSEWAQALFGLHPLEKGEVRLDDRPVRPHSAGQMANQGLAYVPEDRLRQGMCRGLGVGLNAVLASLRQLAPAGWISRGKERRLSASIIERLDVRCTSPSQPILALSGGNQQKVVVGRWLAREPGVLILDEPTRGVDVGAREEIYRLVREQAATGKAVVLISSDLPEVMSQSDRIGVFRTGKLVTTLDAGKTTAEEVAELAFPTISEERASEESARGRRWAVPGELGLLLFLALFFGGMHLVTGRFLQADSLRSLITDATLLGFCATGAMLVLLAGGLDISLGALMALSAGVAGLLWEKGQPMGVVLPVAVGIGGLGGAINAGLAILGRVHPIVVTLGMMSVYRGLTLWWLGQDVQIEGAKRAWAMADIAGLPVLAWIGLGLAVVTGLWLRFTVAGRELFALGSNPRAAIRVGIRPWRVWLIAFTLQGMLVGLAGLLYLSRTGSVQPTSHEDRTLEAIAAAVVGGVAITGGRGRVLGVALGCLLLVSLGPACIFLGLSALWQQSLVGAVLLVAVLADTLLRGRSA